MAKDLSGILKELLGDPSRCSSCHWATAGSGRPITWYCEKNKHPTTPDYSCPDYLMYAGCRPAAPPHHQSGGKNE
jgi:hypothetical protein